ncbi:MAG: SUMF1/EgtB/PvdO family nonheme iron enzyme, partial [Isosphaeraceae bacterium]
MPRFSATPTTGRRLAAARLCGSMLLLLSAAALAGCNRGDPASSSEPPASSSSQAREVRNPTPPGEAPEGMTWIPGGTFLMGSDDPDMADARPVHQVTLDGFWLDRTEVTNRQFARFVKETGYVTVAERPLDPDDFPGVPREKLVPGSLVFTPPVGEVSLDNPLTWWRYVAGANWRHPEGPD